MQKQLDTVRGLELGRVLQTLFKAKGPYGSGEGHPRRFILPDTREVFVSDTSWKIPPAKRGKGAIDLVMALRGYSQTELTKAVGELANAFGVEKVTGECMAQNLERTAASVQRAAREFTPEKSTERGHGRSLGLSR